MSCCRNILNVGRGLWLVLTLERKGSEREGFKEAAAMERSGNGLHSGMVVRGEGDGELVELEGGGGVGFGGSFTDQIHKFGGQIYNVGDQIYGFSGVVSVVVELVWGEVGCAFLVSSERLVLLVVMVGMRR
ncbi:hypothetical protein GYH30_018473 [Glycine max]|nr:hypothetical protein GYH30_018473 [Glycine max]